MEKVFLADMHTHSESSQDSVCPLTERIKEIQNGTCDIFAVTDHCDIPTYKEQSFFERIESSHKSAEKVSKESGFKILKGIELGEGIFNKEYADQVLNAHDYDIIVSSVHYMNYKNYKKPFACFDFSELSKEDLDGVMKQYFNDIITTVNTFDFDVLAHITCPVLYVLKYRDDLDMTIYKEQIEAVLKLLIERNIALELNSAGVLKITSLKEWIFMLYKELGGQLITLGSDSHTAGSLCKDFDTSINLLKKCGFDGYYYFENRKPIKITF